MLTHISKKIKIKRSTADFTSETMKNDIFKMLKEKKKDQLLSTLYQAKLSFQAKETLRHWLPNEQNQRESCMARRPVIQEIPKSVLWIETKGHSTVIQIQYCIGTWAIRFMNHSKLDVVKQEMARANINIWGITEFKMHMKK